MFFKTAVRAAIALIALLMLALPGFANDLTFTGDVSYRERIALPPDARLTIMLVALPAGTPIVGAEGAIAGSVPLQFTLNVRSTVIKPGGDYGLLAEISSAGRTLFRNAEPVPVDAAAPMPVRIVVTAVPASPHEAPEAALPPVEPPNPLLDMVWTVTSIGGDPVLGGSKLTFSVAADLRAGGNGGCNNYFTEASFETDSPLAFGPIAGTRMACEPTVMAQEARFFAALGATAGYLLEGDTLKLVDAAGVPLLGLIRAP
ncbi:META domain-containing protein [Devosia sp. A449]